MRRLILGAGLALAGLILAATTALAGGWALIQPDPGAPQPNAGDEIELGFNVLQHGVTPISWVGATLTATNVETGKRVTVTAKPDGPIGHYVARLTLPEPGFWTWQVELTDLLTESNPAVVTVLTAAGRAPELSPAVLLTAIERSKIDVRRDYEEIIGQQAERYEGLMGAMRIDIAVLKGGYGSLEDSRDKLQARVDELEAGTGGVPTIAVITIAALAGAMAGFGMVLLGRRNQAVPAAPGYVPTTR